MIQILRSSRFQTPTYRTFLDDYFRIQSSKLRSALDIADLIVDYKEVKDGFSCSLEHWRMVDFFGNVILTKEENLFDNFIFSLFHFRFSLTCFRLNAARSKLVTHCVNEI